MSVAESMVILRPIRQVGWLSGVHGDAGQRLGGQVPEGPARRGEDQPAHLRGIAPVQALVDGVVLAVDRQHVDAVPDRSITRRPAITSTSLLARAMRLPLRIAATTASSAAVPDDAHSTVSVVARDQIDQRLGPAPHRSRWAAAGRELRAERLAGGVGGHHHRAGR